MPTSPAEDLLYTTVHLVAEGRDGIADGTGFFYRFQIAEGSVSAIITNNHVIEEAIRVVIVFHDADETDQRTGTYTSYTVELDPKGVIAHPDSSVDLCAICLDIDAVVASTGKRIFNRFLTASTIPSGQRWEEMDAFEEMLMVGCPNGLYDRANHMPIARRGLAASHPSMDFENRREFLIDIAVFPGSSGSPVFLLDRVGILNKITGALDLTQRQKLFVGVLYAGPQIDSEGILVKLPRKVRVETMMHLGYVIKSSELFVLEKELKRRFEAK